MNHFSDRATMPSGRIVQYVTASLFVLTLAACGSDASSTSATSAAGSSATTSMPASLSTSSAPRKPVDDVVEAGAAHLDVPGEPDWLVLAGGSAWTLTSGLARLDGQTGALISTAPIANPVCLAMDTGFGSVWVGTCGTATIVRVDDQTGEVLAVIELSVNDLHEEGSIAVGEGGVWAISSDQSTIVRVDPSTNLEAAAYPAPEGATAIRAGFGSLWVTSFATDTLFRLDPSTGETTATIPVGDGPRFLAVGDNGVWVLNQIGGTVSHVDASSSTVSADVTVDDRSIQGGDIAVGGGAVWARVTSSLVVKIDASSDEVVATYGPASGSGSVAADHEAAWISAHDVNSVWRLPLE